MKRFNFLFAIVMSLGGTAFLFSACTKQCDCHKETHYADYSTEQYYTETVDAETACSSLNGEFFHEDVYGNTVSVDVVNCTNAM
ncbi:MAG: hypothetical protein IK013_09160 [Bacteroidales bacterium]|nr:hypothetical protein [Bacteroidales bacterium]